MTVHAIKLKNFMAFQDTDWVDLCPISLIFGRNSSGKSTIIRALRLLKQSLMYGSPEEPLVLTAEDQIGLRSFATIYNRPLNHLRGESNGQYPPLDGRISFGFRCDLVEHMTLVQEVISDGNPGNDGKQIDFEQKKVDFILSFSMNAQKQQIQLSQIEITLPWLRPDPHHLLKATRIYEPDQRLWYDEWTFESDYFNDLPDNIGDPEHHNTDVQIELISGFLPRLILDEQLEDPNVGLLRDVLAELVSQIHILMDSISHLGPIRPAPERLYLFEEVKMQRWERQGWRHYLEFLGEDVDKEKLPELNHWLQQLDLGSGILAQESHLNKKDGFMSQVIVSENGPAQNGHSLREENTLYTTKPDDVYNFGFHLIDMGYGTSQILPILVRCVQAKAGEFIIIEQPELHLHPRAQAQLGDLFVQTARRGVRLLIETHSEHLLLRLRRWVAETSIQDNQEVLDMLGERRLPIGQHRFLQADELRAYYVYRDSVSKIANLYIDEQGEMDTSTSPDDFDDFFADDLIEMTALLSASLR